MNKRINDCCGVLRLHTLEILVEDQLLQRLVAADGEEDAGHFDVDAVVAYVQRRPAADAVDARREHVAAAVAEDVVAQVENEACKATVVLGNRPDADSWYGRRRL